MSRAAVTTVGADSADATDTTEPAKTETHAKMAPVPRKTDDRRRGATRAPIMPDVKVTNSDITQTLGVTTRDVVPIGMGWG